MVTKDAAISVRVDPELKEKAETLAKADRRTLSSWVEALIAREVARTAKKTARK
jgi:predicted transcriptional regulator